MQMNRLFQIVYLLIQKDKITAKELAQRFDVSVRTIYRDIDVLSEANIPIYTNKGKDGGISLLDNFVLDKSILSEDEQNQILLGLQSLNELNPQKQEDVIEKLSGIFKKETRQWIEVDFSHWGGDDFQNKVFQELKQAILNNKVVEIQYDNSYGQESKRKIEPLKICFKDKFWYIKGYCRLKEEYRIFKISRIREIKITEETFKRELPKEIEVQRPPKIVELTLLIKKAVSYRVYEEFKKEQIQRQENGDFIVTLQYPEDDWVYGYLLSFGEHVTVISPDHSKEIIKTKLEQMIKNYR